MKLPARPNAPATAAPPAGTIVMWYANAHGTRPVLFRGAHGADHSRISIVSSARVWQSGQLVRAWSDLVQLVPRHDLFASRDEAVAAYRHGFTPRNQRLAA